MPLLLLNLYLFFLVVVDGKSRSFRLCVFIPLILLNAFAFYYNFNQVQEASQKRLSKDNLSFISYNFLLDQFVDTDRIAHDHFVAVPSKFNNCSYWQSCSTYQGLVDFNPTVVAFWPEYNPGTPIGGYANTNNLVRYVKEKKMRLVVKLTSNHPDTLGHIIHVYAD